MNDGSNDFELFYNKLKNSIKNKNLVLLIGAGISKNSPSNLPLANEIRKIVVKKIYHFQDLPKDVSSKLIGKKVNGIAYPFEAFIQVLVDNSNFLNALQKIFSLGFPNKNHYLIARLSKTKIKNVLTTNFDEKIEQAINDLNGSKSKSEFEVKVFWNENQFSNLNLRNNRHSNLIKIHGTIRDDKSIRTTLEKIAQRDLLTSRIKILEDFFVNLNCDILIIGYSCSDEFDINPVIRSLKSKNKVFLIKHSTGVTSSQAVFLDLPDPFTEFNGNMIRVDTDEIIDILFKDFFNEDLVLKKMQNSWSNLIIEWSNNLSDAQRIYISGQLLYNIQEYHISEKYFHKYLNILKKEQDQYRIACAYEQLGKLYEALTDFNLAGDYSKKSYDLFQIYGTKEDTARILFQLGRISQQKLDPISAKKYYEKSLEIYNTLKNEREIGQLYYQISTLQQDPVVSEDLVKKSLEIFQEFGDILGLALCYYQLGFVFIMKADLNEAENYTNRAKQKYDLLGHKEGIADCLFQIGSIKQMAGDYKEAKKKTKEALVVFEEIRKKNGIDACLFQIEQINKRLN